MRGAPVIPLHAGRTVRPPAGAPPAPMPRPIQGNPGDLGRRVTPINPVSSSNDGRDQELSDMEIPTFIRRQMD
jgi:hypothetical protein